jgi:hypothetical protein
VPAEIAVLKQRGRPFVKGQSGNPAGKPKGARNRATLAAEALLEGEAEALTRKAVEMALAGDVAALRLCVERIMPPRKERAVPLALPRIETGDDAREAVNVALAAVAEGEITLAEATAVLDLIEAARRAIGPEAAAPLVAPQLRVSFVSAESEASPGGRWP